MDYIFLGDAKTATDRQYLQANGITCIITVAPVEEFPIDYSIDRDGIQSYRIPIPDDGMHPLKPYLSEALRIIRTATDRHEGVLIHCIEGRSRSPALLLAYFLMEKGMNLREAFTLLKRKYTQIQPRYQLFDELLALERDLFGNINTISHQDNYEPIILGAT